jgi:hypothetical protein
MNLRRAVLRAQGWRPYRFTSTRVLDSAVFLSLPLRRAAVRLSITLLFWGMEI